MIVVLFVLVFLLIRGEINAKAADAQEAEAAEKAAAKKAAARRFRHRRGRIGRRFH